MRAVQLFGRQAHRQVAVGFGETAGWSAACTRPWVSASRLSAWWRCRDYIDRHGASTSPARAGSAAYSACFLHRFLPQPFSALSSMASRWNTWRRAGGSTPADLRRGLFQSTDGRGRFSEAAERIDRLRAVTHERHDRWGGPCLRSTRLADRPGPSSRLSWPSSRAGSPWCRGQPQARCSSRALPCRPRPMFSCVAASPLGHGAGSGLAGQPAHDAPPAAPPPASSSAKPSSHWVMPPRPVRSPESRPGTARGPGPGGDELPLRLCRLQGAASARCPRRACRSKPVVPHAALWLRHADAPSPAAWQQYLALPVVELLLALCERPRPTVAVAAVAGRASVLKSGLIYCIFRFFLTDRSIRKSSATITAPNGELK